MKKITVVLSIVVLYLLSSVDAKAQKINSDDVLGIWWNDVKSSKIEIYKEDNKYFGKIVYLTEPNDSETGKPKVDKDNPDENLKSRPLLGLIIMSDFNFDEDEWEDGEIYDPKSGNTYNCYLEFENPKDKNTLKLRGYIGYAFLGLGRTSYFTRVK